MASIAKFEAGKTALLEKVIAPKVPTHAAPARLRESPRLAPHLERDEAVLAERAPKVASGDGRFAKMMTWCHTRADTADHWSWGEPRAWTEHEWGSVISPLLNQFAQLTWQEIDAYSSGSGHKMHHGHELSDLIDEAQKRWLALDLEQFDSVFRFRIGGQRSRAWGFILQAHFHLVWWDREHSIYPTDHK